MSVCWRACKLAPAYLSDAMCEWAKESRSGAVCEWGSVKV